MHEMSVAMGIVDLAISHAAKAESGRILSIDLEVGEMAGVLVDSLRFCFSAVTKETMAAGATLNIIEVPAERECRECKHVFFIKSFTDNCPFCRSYNTTLLRGNELQVKSIVVDD